MGRFADAAIADLTRAPSSTSSSSCSSCRTASCSAWVTGEADVPADHDTPLFRRLRDFNRRGERAR